MLALVADSSSIQALPSTEKGSSLLTLTHPRCILISWHLSLFLTAAARTAWQQPDSGMSLTSDQQSYWFYIVPVLRRLGVKHVPSHKELPRVQLKSVQVREERNARCAAPPPPACAAREPLHSIAKLGLCRLLNWDRAKNIETVWDVRQYGSHSPHGVNKPCVDSVFPWRIVHCCGRHLMMPYLLSTRL